MRIYCIQSMFVMLSSRIASSAAFISSNRMRCRSPLAEIGLQTGGDARHGDDTVPINGRKAPRFPGSIPIDASDIDTCINQTGQINPSNALLGKPAETLCKHGYAQAFSIDPVPSPKQFDKSDMGRLNSGLLKLTCPLLVSSVDLLEDEKFMQEINKKLLNEDEWKECFVNGHKVHAEVRKNLVSEVEVSILKSALGTQGAKSFQDAGVASVNPKAKTPDVKCLHAWLADYLFHIGRDDGIATKDHLIGNAIVEALKERGVDISGTATCHEVCSGCAEEKSGDKAVQVPTPRNKQRRKRSQVKGYGTSR